MSAARFVEWVEREGRKGAGKEVDERGDDEGGGGEGESGVGIETGDVERGGRRKGRESKEKIESSPEGNDFLPSLTSSNEP